ncbi:MAG: HAD family hydrolase, partial [Planctomycetota bacterium]
TDGVQGRKTAEILGVPEDQWHTLVFEQSERRLCGRVKDPVEVITELVQIGGWEIPHGRIAEAARTRQKRFADGMKLVQPHVLATLDRIREQGVLTALCSNADWMESRGWPTSPLKSRFDEAVFSCDVGYCKPQPEIYRITLERLDVDPQEALFVGDGSSNELTGARRLGIRTVLTTEILARMWPDKITQRAADADHVIDNIEQIFDCLKF